MDADATANLTGTPHLEEPTITRVTRRIRGGIPWVVVDRVGRKAWSLIGVMAVVAVCGRLLALAGWFLLPASFSAVIAILAAPLVRILERRGIKRLHATWLVFGGILLVASLLVWMVVPPFVAQAGELAGRLPEILKDAGEKVSDFEQRLDATNPAAGDAAAQFGDELNSKALEFADGLSGTLVDVVTFAFTMAFAFLMGAIIAFLLVKDLPSYTRGGRAWMDSSRNPRLVGMLTQAGMTVRAFVRGQLTLALIVGIMSTAVLGILGVPFFLPLGAIAGVGDLIPSIGPVLAVIPAAVLAWNEGGFGAALMVVVALAIVQQIESYVFVPLIVGNAVELSPLAVMVSLTVAGSLFGLPGLLLAVPLIAIIRDSWGWFSMSPGEARARLAELVEH